MASLVMRAFEGRRTALEGFSLFLLDIGAMRSVGRDAVEARWGALLWALLGIPVVAVARYLAGRKMRSGLIYMAPSQFT